MRDLLDVHAAFGRDDHRDAAGLAVDQHRQIIFGGNVDAIGDVEAVDLLAGVTGLDGDQRVAEHFARVLANIVERLGEAHTALGIGTQFLELALAATAGMNLRLDDVKRPRQLFGAGNRFFDGQRGMAGRDADAIFREQFLGLIFVDVHEGSHAFLMWPGGRLVFGPNPTVNRSMNVCGRAKA